MRGVSPALDFVCSHARQERGVPQTTHALGERGYDGPNLEVSAMQKALATFRLGQIEFDSGVDWPEGTRVEVFPLSVESVGMNEADWPTTPEGIAALLKRMDEREPLEMPDTEYAAWEDISFKKGSTR